MYRVKLVFKGTPKNYYYNTKLKLMEGAKYKITADGQTNYTSPVYIEAIAPGHFDNVREITSAELLEAPPKPEKPYKKIVVNHKKETICVLWIDGTKTVLKPQPGDTFDIEKGIALCFMKKCFNNRGCFNDAFRDIEEM